MNKKQPQYKDVTTEHIYNFSFIGEWLKKSYDAASAGTVPLLTQPAMLITRDNRKAMKKVFGPPCQHFRGTYDYHCWRIEFGGAAFWVLSNGIRGTAIEVETPLTVPPQTIPDFLDWLCGKFIEAE